MPEIHEEYFLFCVVAVTDWLKSDYKQLLTICETHNLVLDENEAAKEALAAVTVTGNRALSSLPHSLSSHLEASAITYAIKMGVSKERLDFWQKVSRDAVDDESFSFAIGPTLLTRCGFTAAELQLLTRTSIPKAVGGLLYAEAIMGWRRAQDRGDSGA